MKHRFVQICRVSKPDMYRTLICTNSRRIHVGCGRANSMWIVVTAMRIQLRICHLVTGQVTFECCSEHARPKSRSRSVLYGASALIRHWIRDRLRFIIRNWFMIRGFRNCRKFLMRRGNKGKEMTTTVGSPRMGVRMWRCKMGSLRAWMRCFEI